MSTGLLLGKFAPLHRGHQLLVETALAENEQVLAMIYHAPDVTDVPLPVRAGWIRDLYPRVEVIEAWDGPLEVGDAPELQRRHEQYILSQLAGRRVDEARQQVPISATAIRAEPYNNRHFLDPRVYRDLISRVVLLGAPSTGKTTLAEALARHHATCWMPEYGREYWERHQQDRRLSPEQLVEIAEGHRQREDELMAQANRFLFVDTDASTTRHFARHYHGSVHPRLQTLAEETAQRYDLFLLCEDDIPYDDSWDRSGEANRRIMQAQIRAELVQRRLPCVHLKGSLVERLEQANGILRRFRKYRLLSEALAVPSDKR